MIAFASANPAKCLKFTVISDGQATGKLCCVTFKDGCISQMGITGGLPPLLFMTVS